MKTEDRNDGKTWIDCQSCGQMYPVDPFDGNDSMRRVHECYRRCAVCAEAEKLADEAEKKRQKREKYVASMPKWIVKAGIPPQYRVETPPVKHVADWVWSNRNSNLLLSGATGTGKSTSVCYNAIQLILAEKKIRYCSLRKLLEEWRAAKMSDQTFAVENFLERIGSLNILIIDEVVNKAHVSASGQEMLFELLDGVYSGDRSNRLWLVGNFYKGSLAAIFDDVTPVLRRIKECFICGVAQSDGVKEVKFEGDFGYE